MTDIHLTTEQGFEIAFTLTVVGGIAYFSGPIAAMLARELFTAGYEYCYGTPGYIAELTIVGPWREHLAHWAYNYGAGGFALACSPFVYKFLDFIGRKLGFGEPKLVECSSEEYKELKGTIQNLKLRLSDLAKEFEKQGMSKTDALDSARKHLMMHRQVKRVRNEESLEKNLNDEAPELSRKTSRMNKIMLKTSSF